ncbi:kinase-like protein [Lentinus brumalis]|uniref:Kinase-like protein n=1 Tax=Lentinus brumalis TaxID=2498619 RepID=A0A371DXG8_9APHY|nr:kinase-like protein [Polyporus brumalis]
MSKSNFTLADNRDNNEDKGGYVPSCFFHENELAYQEQLGLYRRGYLHPVAVTDIIRPDPSTSATRSQDAPSGYRVLHKLGAGGEATVWLAQELDRLDRIVSLKIFSARFFSAGEREARALKACMRSPSTPFSQNVLSLLDDFTISGPNGTHKGHVTEVLMPLRKLSPILPTERKKEVARDIVRGLAHVHHCGFVHGDIHIGNVGCAMPPQFAEEEVKSTMSLLDRYDVTMVITENPASRSTSLPPYLLSPCDLLSVYKDYDGLEAHQAARLYDFGNARRVGEENGTDAARRAYPPPEVAFGHYGCGGLTVLPTMAGDIWCLGALIIKLFTDQLIIRDPTIRYLLQQAMLDGVIPPAWRDYWDSVEYLRSKSDQISPEKADADWLRRRAYFMEKNPQNDDAEIDLLFTLLRRMVAADPETRPSVDEVLTHPWFSDDLATRAAALTVGSSLGPATHPASDSRIGTHISH